MFRSKKRAQATLDERRAAWLETVKERHQELVTIGGLEPEVTLEEIEAMETSELRDVSESLKAQCAHARALPEIEALRRAARERLRSTAESALSAARTRPLSREAADEVVLHLTELEEQLRKAERNGSRFEHLEPTVRARIDSLISSLKKDREARRAVQRQELRECVGANPFVATGTTDGLERTLEEHLEALLATEVLSRAQPAWRNGWRAALTEAGPGLRRHSLVVALSKNLRDTVTISGEDEKTVETLVTLLGDGSFEELHDALGVARALA